jgi:hypothetical protein
MKHYLIRPPKGAVEVERLTDGGNWVDDDGRPSLAFSGKLDGFPYAWYPHCDHRTFIDDCPKELSGNRTCSRFGCSNGQERPRCRKRKKRTP